MALADWLFGGALCLAWLTRRRTPFWRAELLLGLGFGALWERLFSDFWTYNPQHFGVFIQPNLPLAMIAFWAALFVGGMGLAEGLSRSRLLLASVPGRDLVWDVLAFASLGIAMESVGLYLSFWRYDAGLSLGVLPLLQVSTFAALGYISIGVFIPTSLRHWRAHLLTSRA